MLPGAKFVGMIALAALAGSLGAVAAAGEVRGRLTLEMENLRRVSVPIDELVEDVIGEEIGRDDRLIFEKDDFRLIFRRDPRGKFFVDVLGPTTSTARILREEALRFARDLVREFAYNRVVQEMEARGINVVNEQVEEESGDIVLEARRWQ